MYVERILFFFRNNCDQPTHIAENTSANHSCCSQKKNKSNRVSNGSAENNLWKVGNFFQFFFPYILLHFNLETSYVYFFKLIIENWVSFKVNMKLCHTKSI